MQDLMDFGVADQALWDPLTSASELMLIALYHPSLRGAVAAHPHADEGLVEWLRDQPVVRIAEQGPVVPDESRSVGHTRATRGHSRLELTVGIILIVVALVVTAVVVVNVWDVGQRVADPTSTKSTGPTSTKTAEPIDGQVYTFGGSNMERFFDSIFVDDEGVIYMGGSSWSKDGGFPGTGTEEIPVWVVIDAVGQVAITQADIALPRIRFEDGFLGVGRHQTFFEAFDSISTILQRHWGPAGFHYMSITVTEDGTMAVLDSQLQLLGADGTELWVPISFMEDDWNVGFYATAFFPDGSLCVVGYTNGRGITEETNHPGAIVLILDPQGNIRSLRNLGSHATYLKAVWPSPDGTVVAVGTGYLTGVDSNAVVAKINASGDIVWVESFGGSLVDIFNAVTVDANGGIFVAGASSSRDGDFVERPVYGVQGKRDAVIAHIDPDGSLVWAQLWAGSRYDELSAISANNGRICAVGGTTSLDGVFQDAWGAGDGMVICVNQ